MGILWKHLQSVFLQINAKWCMLRKMTQDTLGKDVNQNLEGGRISLLTEADLLTIKLFI